jgi:hypothetical protein
MGDPYAPLKENLWRWERARRPLLAAIDYRVVWIDS